MKKDIYQKVIDKIIEDLEKGELTCEVVPLIWTVLLLSDGRRLCIALDHDCAYSRCAELYSEAKCGS